MEKIDMTRKQRDRLIKKHQYWFKAKMELEQKIKDNNHDVFTSNHSDYKRFLEITIKEKEYWKLSQM